MLYPLSYGTTGTGDTIARNDEPSVRPAVQPAELEVLGVGLRSLRRLLRLLDTEGNALARGEGDCLLLVGEAHAHLRLGLGRAGPAHQRLRQPSAARARPPKPTPPAPPP